MWESPIYKLRAENGKYIFIDVTTSCAPGLAPNKVIIEIAQFFKKRKVKRVLDVGAGSLRHTRPLLRRGFQVCAVEYKEQFARPACKEALKRARRSPNFSALIFPNQFIKDERKFDAAIISFVIPTMPKAKERQKLLKIIKKKLRKKSYIVWMSQYGKNQNSLSPANKVNDGWFLWANRKYHSFYTEFTNEEIDEMLKKIKYERIRSPSKRGSDQFRVYKGEGGLGWA